MFRKIMSVIRRLSSVRQLSVVALLVVGLASVLIAANPLAEAVTLNAITGTGSYTNTRNYTTMQLVNLEVFQSLCATSTVTCTRVRSGRTNTVAAIALSSGAGIYRETNTVYLFKGDVLHFANVVPNDVSATAVVEITVNLQP
jgi:hypothetical protein